MVHTNLVCITKFKGWSTSLHDDFDIASESVSTWVICLQDRSGRLSVWYQTTFWSTARLQLLETDMVGGQRPKVRTV